MSLIIYERPAIKKSEARPAPMEGKSYPYNMLADDRRFEELLYSIYRGRIESGTLTAYDDISLMSGVRDKGRDCVLYRKGKITGIVQCKMSGNSLAREIFGKEITKFALYALLHPELIPDRSDFVYFIAVSKGFTSDCHKLIDDFATQIRQEPKLSRWISDLRKQPMLTPLKETFQEGELLDILTKIKICKVQPPDLDRYLSERALQQIVPLFFQVRTVTDNNLIAAVDKKLDRWISGELDAQEIKKQLERGSAGLRVQDNQLDHVADSHIPRSETQALLNWVLADAPKDQQQRDQNICLLSGEAGIGKTVILKDLYELLRSAEIPVLALKADKLNPVNMPDLQQKISLSLPVPDFLDQCRQQFFKTIILIDQIDALSQSMSADRNYLLVFRQLIDQLMYDSNVRVIISVRPFDLNYDPTLKVYKNIKAIKVSLLKDEEVYKQLAKVNISRIVITPKLLTLLRNPNHLNIFTTIVAGSNKSLTEIDSLQELYLELWLQKIVQPLISTVDGDDLKRLLYGIAGRMFADQRIAVSQHEFESDQKELAYLESERLIRVQDKQIQFFHQSFYDFIFAKRFVEEGKDVLRYIRAQNQTILIRAAIKMILNYLRTYDPQRYVRELERLLSNRSVFFHIRHLIISMLAAQDTPIEAEQHLFKILIVPSAVFRTVFFEHVYSTGWTTLIFELRLLDHLIQPAQTTTPGKWQKFRSWLTKTDIQASKGNANYYRHICSQFLRNQLAQNAEAAFDLALEIKDHDLIKWLLFTLHQWDNPKSFKLLAKVPELWQQQDRNYFHILKDILEYDPTFVFDKVKDVILVDSYFDDTRRNDLHDEKKFLKALYDKLPEQLLQPLLDNLDAVMSDPRYASMGFNGDFKYKNVRFSEVIDEEFYDGHELLQKMLALSLRHAATHQTERFLKIAEKFQIKTDYSYLRPLIFAYQAEPRRYVAQILALFDHLATNNLLDYEDKLSNEYRNLFEVTFPFFSQQQQRIAIELIRSLRVPGELYIYQRPDDRKRYSIKKWGLTKYFFLKRVPYKIIEKDLWLRRDYLALDRKFHNYHDVLRPDYGIARPVSRPLSPEAYQKMRPKDWIRSFRKYNVDRDDWNNFRGALREHSGGFHEFAKNNPEEAIVILSKIVADPTIAADYKINGLWGLTESEIVAERILPFVLQCIPDRSYETNTHLFLHVIDHLFRHECYNERLIAFVIELALNENEPQAWEKELTKTETSIDGLVTRAINSIPGKAAKCLLYIHDPAQKQLVFDTITQLLKHGAPPIRAVLYWRFAYLMQIDESAAFNLFNTTVASETDVNVLASSLWTLQYLINYDFSRLVPLFTKLIAIPKLGSDDRKFLGRILFFSFLKGYDTAKTLLFDFLKRHPQARSSMLFDAMEYFYQFKDSPTKSLETLYFLIGPASEEVEEDIRFNLFKLENLKFLDIYPFLTRYVDSKGFRLNEDLVNYLIMSCKDRPFDCVDLFNKAISKGKSDQDDDMLREEDHLTQFVIAGYNAIKGNDRKSNRYRHKLLRAFDKILIDHRFRNKAENVLEAV